MPSHNDETGVTNLGRVPPGMTFEAATRDAQLRFRKYQINPHEGGHRLTLCDTLRHLHRSVDANMDGSQKAVALELIAACFDYAKRMDARIKELKRNG